MAAHVVHKKGKDYIVIDTRPSKRIRKAQRRHEKRKEEIRQHFRNRKESNV